jgi:hypothetical protein
MTLRLEGVEIPHSTACLLNINRLHFTCYHFTSKNFLQILRFESRCFQLYRAQLYVIGSGRNKCFVCIKISTYLRTYSKIIACKGSGILTLLFFQGLCETLTHSAWTKAVHVKRKAPLFGCTVCTCRMAGSVADILGYLIKLWCYFSAVSIKGSLLWLYALA